MTPYNNFILSYDNNLCSFDRNLFNKNVSLRGILLYIYLLSISNTGIDFELAENRLKFTKGTIKSYLKELENHNLIKMIVDGKDIQIEIIGVGNE